MSEVFGIISEELDSLYPTDRNGLIWKNGARIRTEVKEYAEILRVSDAEVLATYESDFYAGSAAVTRKQYGKGVAYYYACRVATPDMQQFFAQILAEAGVATKELLGVEYHVRVCFIHSLLFVNSLYDENYRIVSDWKFYTEKIIFGNCTIRNIPLIVSSFQGGGITECNTDLNKLERQQVLKQMLPLKVLADYERFKDKESPVLYLIPEFNHTYRLEKLIYWMIKIILKIYKLVK